MNLFLSTSPHIRHAAVLQNDFSPDKDIPYRFAPLGLLSLAAVIKKKLPKVNCQLYDINFEIKSGNISLDNRFYASIAENICSNSPTLIGFMTECDSYHHILQITKAIKFIRPDCFILLGGPHASAVAHKTMERWQYVDGIVVGEGEETFPEVVEAILDGFRNPIPGAIIKTREGSLVDGGKRPLISCLNDIPIPAFEMYHPDENEEIFIEVGRGCPFQCTFCSTAPYWNFQHRVKTPARILQEIYYIRNLYGNKRLHFVHDLFTTNRAWVKLVCDELIASNVPIRWTCSARVDTVDEPLLEHMALAGCDAIYFGIESGSERILKEIKKDIPLSQTFNTLKICNRLGIKSNAGFIAGFPTEDATSLRDTFSAYERVLRLGCRPTHIFGFCPFADSSIYGGLTGVRCSGHFLDLPLGIKVDKENRQLVSSDQDLFGAYFRPYLPDVVEGEEIAIPAIDEFSPLVETVLMPSLALAKMIGGMYEVFRNWLQWIQTYNDARGAETYRKGYGTPYLFAKFVFDQLSAISAAPAEAIEAAMAIQMNLQIFEMANMEVSTSMATHRSLTLPVINKLPEISLGTPLSLGPIVGSLALNFDVTSALLGNENQELKEEPTYLVWQKLSDGTIRLLHINQVIFDTIELLRFQIATPGDLLIKQNNKISKSQELIERERDASKVLESLKNAVNEGLVTIESSQNAQNK